MQLQVILNINSQRKVQKDLTVQKMIAINSNLFNHGWLKLQMVVTRFLVIISFFFFLLCILFTKKKCTHSVTHTKKTKHNKKKAHMTQRHWVLCDIHNTHTHIVKTKTKKQKKRIKKQIIRLLLMDRHHLIMTTVIKMTQIKTIFSGHLRHSIIHQKLKQLVIITMTIMK